MDKEKILDEIFNSDPLGILEVKSKNSNTMNTEDRLINSFEDINEFYEKNDREPERNVSNISEYQLYTRLKGIRENTMKIESLKSSDKFNLLEVVEVKEEGEKKIDKEINSLDDLLEMDFLDILSDESEGLFDFKHTPKNYGRESADLVGKRKPCKNFGDYEEKFKEVQSELTNGERRLVEFREDNLKEGSYYVYNGILMLLEKINISQTEKTFKTGKRVRKDGRTRCIFENGTESNILYRSVAKALYANGRVVSRTIKEINNKMFTNIEDSDNEVGYIYVLRSKSTDERITSIDNLFKIGYSKNEVENRIKNAENEPTYLMAPVNIVTSWKCYNMNPQKLEQLLHTFLGTTCLNIDVIDNNGKRCTPREWFIVPFKIMEQAIELIISGEVINYRYDKELMVIVER